MGNAFSSVREAEHLLELRARRATGAVAALVNAYAREPVIFFKTLDNLSIAVGEPVGIRVTRADDQRQFNSLDDPAALVGSSIAPFGGKLSFQVLCRPGGDQIATNASVSRATGFLEQFQRCLLAVETPSAIDQIASALEAGFEQAAAAPDSREHASAPLASGGVTEAQATEQLNELFERLEPFLTAGNYRFGLPGEHNSPRFLFFHRYIDRSGRPDVRLNLLASQSAQLGSLLGKGAASAFADAAARVFRTDRWHIENSFRTGVTCWTQWPWQIGDEDEDKLRVERALTSLASGKANEDLLPDDELASAFLIPIHVDGLPWLAIAGVVRAHDQDTLLWAQDFYRDLLPYLTTTIRGAAERAYLSEIRRIARQSVEEGQADLVSLTEALSRLTATFPYKKIVLSEAVDGSEGVFDWCGVHACLESENLGFDASRVQYAWLGRQGVVAALQDGEHDAAKARERRLEARLLSYINVGHTLKNVVSCTGWPAAAREVGLIDKYFDSMVAAGFTADDVGKLRLGLGYAARSLSLFWLVEGLGHFIRLAGAQAGNFEWAKFADWIDPVGEPTVTAEASAKAYVDSVYALATSLSYGSGWHHVRVCNPGLTEQRSWAGEAPSPLKMYELHLPPFARGSDAAYVFAFCILEPIVNAIRALKGLSEQMPEGGPASSLDILVHDSDQEGVLIEVVNLSLTGIPEILSGLESTKAMAREVGIATFFKPVSRRLESGLHEVTYPVRFTPNAIANAIRSAGDAGGG
jgi:hypothetical protein